MIEYELVNGVVKIQTSGLVAILVIYFTAYGLIRWMGSRYLDKEWKK
jgi:hypothetical protein